MVRVRPSLTGFLALKGTLHPPTHSTLHEIIVISEQIKTTEFPMPYQSLQRRFAISLLFLSFTRFVKRMLFVRYIVCKRKKTCVAAMYKAYF